MKIDEINEILPCPLMVHIVLENTDEFGNFLGLEDIVEEYNRTTTKQGIIDHNQMYVKFWDFCDKPNDINTFEIYVGGESVVVGRLEDPDDYYPIRKCIEGVLYSYHDKIIEQQITNKKTLEDLERNESYEILLEYCRLFKEEDYFYFLKKLSKTSNFYFNKLKRVYRGNYKAQYENFKMFKKLRNMCDYEYYKF